MNKHSTCIGILILVLALCLLAPARFALAQTSLDWPFYGNDLANTRYQNVDQINPSNVATLKVAWIFHTGVLDPKAELEVSTVEVNGTAYITDGHDDVFAVDAVTGSQKWAYTPITIPGEMPPLTSISVCCGRNNRGVVFVPNMGSGAGAVIYGRLDDVVVALDAATGAVLWKTTVANFQDRVAINMAPQLANGLVFVATAGGEFLTRGEIVALEANTGKIAWRFFTAQKGTWGGDSWKRGGAMAWQNPSVDLDLGLLYTGTETLRRTSMAFDALATTCMRRRSLLSIWRPATSDGFSRRLITISGITTAP